MSGRSTHHTTFVIECSPLIRPPGTFSPQAGRRNSRESPSPRGAGRGWRGAPGEGAPDGIVHAYDAVYHDIVKDERIVYAYAMDLDERRISVSLATVELAPAAGATRLTFTEQAAFLDEYDEPEDRERGTHALLENLAKEVQR